MNEILTKIQKMTVSVGQHEKKTSRKGCRCSHISYLYIDLGKP